jgi:hypothetical protein
MGARKKTARKRQGDDGGADVRAFTVVVEEINSKINVFGEKVQALDERIERRFDALDERMERRFDTVDREIALVRAEMKAGFLATDYELGLVKAAVLHHSRDIKELRLAVDDLDARKVDRDELAPPPSSPP